MKQVILTRAWDKNFGYYTIYTYFKLFTVFYGVGENSFAGRSLERPP